MKQCKKCKLTLPLTKFNKTHSTKDKLRTHCQTCENSWQQLYYKRNKEKIATRKKTHRQINIENVVIREKISREKNKENYFLLNKLFFNRFR